MLWLASALSSSLLDEDVRKCEKEYCPLLAGPWSDHLAVLCASDLGLPSTSTDPGVLESDLKVTLKQCQQTSSQD